MPFTRKQIQQISNVRGQAYIAPDRMPRQLRIAETYIRRRLYSLEDKTVLKDLRLFREMFSQFQQMALSTAPDGKLTQTATQWRRNLLDQLTTRMQTVARQIAAQDYAACQMAWNAGLGGRLWGMESALKPGTPLNKTLPPMPIALDDNWLEPYLLEADGFIIRAKRMLTTALNGQTALQAVNALRDELGVGRGAARGVFYRMQLLTRTNIMLVSNRAALQAVKQQIGILREDTSGGSYITGLIWVSSRDRRVCPTCEGLDGKVWIVNDLDNASIIIDMPPMGSHPACRCTVVVALMPAYLRSENEPLEKTFLEWLIDNGYEVYLKPFIDLTDLDSSQVTLVYQ